MATHLKLADTLAGDKNALWKFAGHVWQTLRTLGYSIYVLLLVDPDTVLLVILKLIRSKAIIINFLQMEIGK